MLQQPQSIDRPGHVSDEALFEPNLKSSYQVIKHPVDVLLVCNAIEAVRRTSV